MSLVLAVQSSHSRPAGALTCSQLENNVIFIHFVVCSELTFHRVRSEVGTRYLLTDFSLDWCPVAHMTISLCTNQIVFTQLCLVLIRFFLKKGTYENSNSFSVENTDRHKHDTVWLNINHVCRLPSASSACAEEEFSADWRQNNNHKNMECDERNVGKLLKELVHWSFVFKH